ncbi:MAG: CotH kinase family protein [Clostridiales bacterium]|nr:CotH kinase family protein [Clostridiales bacterium]
MKKIRLLVALFVLIMFGIGIFLYDNKPVKVRFNSRNEMSLLITSNERTERLYPWYDGSSDTFYFFIPSYVKEQTLYFGSIWGGKKITIDGKRVWNSSFEWEKEVTYEVNISGGLDEEQSYYIKFMQSSNLPAVFINTKSGNMEYINQDKNNEEKGAMDIILSDGSIDYCGSLDKISGRGNATWLYLPKKPYAITLQDEISLCGMRKSKKWKLMALASEGGKINNKLIYDMAEAMGLSNTTDAKWVDLYLNGEYNGIYMLNEAITIANEENGNSTDGYLFELDTIYYNEESEDCKFATSSGNCFVIHEPRNVSAEEKAYIMEYVQMLENLLEAGNTDYRNYLDLDSFAKRFLINEISLNIDSNITSVYFYKYANDDLCYAGPVWDYDMSLGAPVRNSVDYEGTSDDYTQPYGLFWYASLHQDSEFQEKVLEAYKNLLPYMQELLEYGIDEYADWIEASVRMDNVRWKPVAGEYPGHYSTWEDNIRYIKYFLANRLNYLNQSWNISYETFTAPVNGSVHEVFFEKDGEIIETQYIMDGDTITNLPELGEEYKLWFYEHSEELYSDKIPVYENVVLYAK